MTHDWQLSTDTRLHFVGAGGIGMSGLAKVLLQAGFAVTGSDVREHENLDALRALGATITVGHAQRNVPDDAVVVCSTAIGSDNPEVAIAQQRQQRILHRSDVLKHLLHSPAFPHTVTVGITGSHGKTSTTGMVASGLTGGGVHPTAIAGGLFPATVATPLTNAVLGNTNGIAVAELDESDGSLTQYTSDVTVLLNLEMDHAEHFPGGLPQLQENIRTFVQQLGECDAPKTIVANAACANTMAVVNNAPANVTVLTFDWWQETNQADVTLANVTEHAPARFAGDVVFRGETVARLTMSAPGKHQLGNGAIAAVIAYGLANDGVLANSVPQALRNTIESHMDNAMAGINAFTGMGRRFEVVGHKKGALLVDDYAHHPTEIAAMLAVGKAYAGNSGKLLAVFEPHRFSRLQLFWDEFQTALALADVLWVTPVYAASEPPRDGITSDAFCKELATRYPEKQVALLPLAAWESFVEDIASQLCAGDMVMSLGAGNVTKLLRGKGDASPNDAAMPTPQLARKL